MRLWRARRRRDRIDAVLARGARWELRFYRNDRLLFSRPYAREAEARADAASRLEDLRRAGWVDHW